MGYIYINDSTGNENLWQIIKETDNEYKVQRYETVDFIYKELCQKIDGSNALRTNITIDFDSTIIIEDEEWYAEHEKFMNCECFNCWMICYDEENII